MADPYANYPEGRVKAVEIDLSDSKSARTITEPVIVPEWAVSFSVYGDGTPWGNSTVVRITGGPPGSGLFRPFPVAVELENSTEAALSARHIPCTPGSALRAETTTGTTGADEHGKIVFEFSAAAGDMR